MQSGAPPFGHPLWLSTKVKEVPGLLDLAGIAQGRGPGAAGGTAAGAAALSA
jgi:hypothetical protein